MTVTDQNNQTTPPVTTVTATVTTDHDQSQLFVLVWITQKA